MNVISISSSRNKSDNYKKESKINQKLSPQEIREKAIELFGGRESGQRIEGMRCPACGELEAFMYPESGIQINCSRQKNCSLGTGEKTFSLLDFLRNNSRRTIIEKPSVSSNSDNLPEKKSWGPVITKYQYKDANSSLYGIKQRHEPKQFSWSKDYKTPSGEIDFPLYNEHLLNKDNFELIFITEGEKDADNLIKMGLLAISAHSTKGGQPIKRMTSVLKDRDIVICEDNDKAGRDYTERLKKALSSIVSSLKILSFKDCKESYDISDWLSEGHTKEDLIEITSYLQEEEDDHLMPYSATLNDTGNARRIYGKMLNKVLYIPEKNQWWIYEKGRWNCNEAKIQGIAKREIKKKLLSEMNKLEKNDFLMVHSHLKASLNTPKILSMLGSLLSEPNMTKSLSEFDNKDELLNFQNGTFDLKTGKLKKHYSNDLFTYVIPVNAPSEIKIGQYKEQGPVFAQFLEDITCRDEELRNYLQVAMGSALIYGNPTQNAFILYDAVTATGKSTFLQVIANTFGPIHRRVEIQWFLKGRRPSENHEFAQMLQTRIATCGESPKNASWDEPRFKEITGGDEIAIRGKYWRDTISTNLGFTLFLAMNDRPAVNAYSSAMWRRICCIPFNNHVPLEKRDPNLVKKMSEDSEKRAIVAWALEGCRMFYENNMRLPCCKKVEEATKEYKLEEDVLQRFLDCCTEKGDAFSVGASNLFMAYKDFVKTEHPASEDISQKRFGTLMVSKGYKNVHIKKTVYKGLHLLEGE
jgi:putative DNA primase/helicase